MKTQSLATSLTASILAFGSSAALALTVNFTKIPDIEPSLGSNKPLAVANDGTVAFMSTSYELLTWKADTGKTVVHQPTAGIGTRVWPTISDDASTVLYSNFYQSGHEQEDHEDYYYKDGELTIYTYNATNVPNLYAMSGDGSVIGGYTNRWDGIWPSVIDNGSFARYTQGTEGHKIAAFNHTGDKFVTSPYSNGITTNPAIIEVWQVGGGVTESTEEIAISDFSASGDIVLGTLPASWPSDPSTVLWNATTNTSVYITDMAQAKSFSADASVVVGNGRYVNTMLIWDNVNGLRNLNDLLFSYGVDLSGWSDLQAMDISPDGSKIVGSGIDPNGNTRVFLVDLIQQCSPYL